MRKNLLSAATLAAAVACSPLAFAQATASSTTTRTTTSTTTPATSSSHWNTHGQKSHGMRHHGSWGDMAMLKQLNLSDAQSTQIKQLWQTSSNTGRADMQALGQKRMAYENATPGTAGYQSAASALAQAESSATQQRVMREADLRSKIYTVLTPAQRTKLASLRSERQQKMQQRHEAWAQKHNAHPMQTPAPATSASN